MPGEKTIAIVDDDAAIGPSLSSLLRSIGYGAESFQSASALLERLGASDFACVISDIHMPLMDGFELLRFLVKTAPDLPVILMTGRVEVGQEERARSLGASSFLTKPLSANTLFQTISSVTRSRER